MLTVDPAMGTGTYLHAILEHAARAAEQADGPGAVPGAVSQVAGRVVGFELQMGPYAVAELRTADLLASHGAAPPPGGMRLYVTDTLDDPYAAQTQIGSGLQLIAASRRKANKVKATRQRHRRDRQPALQGTRRGRGRLGRERRPGARHRRAGRSWRTSTSPGAGRFKAKLKNLYIYFWRWATWKVWESTGSKPGGDAGIVCFISTSGYLTGPAFTGMREYLRRHASEGWIIDLTPEGQTPDVPTRIFPGVRQPLAIGMFLRSPGTSEQVPAVIRYRAVTGRQEDKFAALAGIGLDDDGWREVRTGWTDSAHPGRGRELGHLPRPVRPDALVLAWRLPDPHLGLRPERRDAPHALARPCWARPTRQTQSSHVQGGPRRHPGQGQGPAARHRHPPGGPPARSGPTR